jgi:fatty acid desaturase
VRYIADDCCSDGIFFPETETEEAEAARLNAPQRDRDCRAASAAEVLLVVAIITACAGAIALRLWLLARCWWAC